MASPSADEARNALQHLMDQLYDVDEDDLEANVVLADFINERQTLSEVIGDADE